MNALARRRFLERTLGTGTAMAVLGSLPVAARSETKTTQLEPDGFFTLDRRKDHWWLTTPAGEMFFSLGGNHIDAATLRHPENIGAMAGRSGATTFRS